MSDAPLRLRLDGDALVANWRWLAARNPQAACGAAVKADAYGVGAKAVVARLAAAGCRDFFVATWAEAQPLAWMLGGASLSVLHGVREVDMADALASPARPVLNSPDQVARWKPTGRPCDVMVDTGMNRLGLTPAEARSGLLDGLAIETLMSHLACADEPEHPMNDMQRAAFAAVAGAVPARRYSLANSAGIMLGEEFGFDLVRPGLALYGGAPGTFILPGEGEVAPKATEGEVGDHPSGALPSSPSVMLRMPPPFGRGGCATRQVAVPEAEILQVRDVPADATIGYGAIFTASRNLKVAILNIGYADGYFRAFTGHGVARAGEVACPLVGRVSMDLVAADVTTADVREGDWLALDFDLPAAAAATGLSQYELLTGMGRRYSRVWE